MTVAARLAGTAQARPRLALVLLSLCFFLPGLFSLPVTDRDEARFAQATKQMLETGDLVTIRFQQAERNKKPAGIHWLQAGSVRLLSNHDRSAIWAYRIPSVLGALIAVLVVHRIGVLMGGPPVGLVAGALTGGSILLIAEANIAKADAVLLASAVIAQGLLARAYLGRSGESAQPLGLAAAMGFWAALGASILIKGPIVPMVCALTAAGLVLADRRAAWLADLRPLPGCLLAIALVLPWIVAIQMATDGRFLAESLGQDLFAKAQSGQESHGAPPLTHLLLLPVTFWPGSLLLLPAAYAAWHRRAEPTVRFCLAWIIPGWVVFELVPTKLPHYVLPFFPALALLIGMALRAQPLPRWPVRAGVLLWLIPGLALAAAPPLLMHTVAGRLDPPTIAASVIVIGLVVWTAAAAWRQEPVRALVTGLTASAVVAVVALELTAPRLAPLWVSNHLARAVSADTVSGPIALSGYREPSAVFLLGTETRLLTPEDAADFLAAYPSATAFVDRRDEAAFQAKAAEIGLAVQAAGAVEGFNYSKGRPVHLTRYAVAPP